MRLLLIIVGALAAIVSIEKLAEAQNGAWCMYINGDGDGEPHCRYATFEQCLADRFGSNTCSPTSSNERWNKRQPKQQGARNRRPLDCVIALPTSDGGPIAPAVSRYLRQSAAPRAREQQSITVEVINTGH